LAVHIKN